MNLNNDHVTLQKIKKKPKSHLFLYILSCIKKRKKEKAREAPSYLNEQPLNTILEQKHQKVSTCL